MLPDTRPVVCSSLGCGHRIEHHGVDESARCRVSGCPCKGWVYDVTVEPEVELDPNSVFVLALPEGFEVASISIRRKVVSDAEPE